MDKTQFLHKVERLPFGRFLAFGIKEAWAALFGGLMLIALVVNWNFSVGADWNHDGTPDFYAFNKQDPGSGHTVYYVLDGTSPEHVLQVGATAFGFTDANYSFTVGPDFNHDGTPDFYGFDKQDAGTGKTVYFVLNGKAPDQFLQIGATPMSFTDANWDFGVVG